MAQRRPACVFDIVLPERLFDWLATAPKLDAVIHMGAISATTAMDADLVYDVNVTFSTQLWDWCARCSVSLIYASSAATYGDGLPALTMTQASRPWRDYVR